MNCTLQSLGGTSEKKIIKKIYIFVTSNNFFYSSSIIQYKHPNYPESDLYDLTMKYDYKNITYLVFLSCSGLLR